MHRVGLSAVEILGNIFLGDFIAACFLSVVFAGNKPALQEEAELEKKHAMDDMKQEMITVAAMMAQKVVAASIDTNIQSTLVDETLKEMGESTWLS